MVTSEQATLLFSLLNGVVRAVELKISADEVSKSHPIRQDCSWCYHALQ